MLIQGQIDPVQDAGTTAVIKLIGRQDDITPVTTRPIFSIQNNSTLLWELDVNGNVNMQGNALNLDIGQSLVPGSSGIDVNLPTGDTLDVNIDGTPEMTLSETLFDLPNVLFSRSGTNGITASTTQTQGNGALTTEINEIGTVANTNDTVTLPTAIAFVEITIINDGANTVQIFPASGDDLGQGVDTATTLAAGSNIRFVAIDVINWRLI